MENRSWNRHLGSTDCQNRASSSMAMSRPHANVTTVVRIIASPIILHRLGKTWRTERGGLGCVESKYDSKKVRAIQMRRKGVWNTGNMENWWWRIDMCPIKMWQKGSVCSTVVQKKRFWRTVDVENWMLRIYDVENQDVHDRGAPIKFPQTIRWIDFATNA